MDKVNAGPGIDNALALTTYGSSETNSYYYLTDHLSSVLAITDESGALVERYSYDGWGRTTVSDAHGMPMDESALGNRIAFQGREIAWTTGLYNFRARWYDPITGRWLSKDPIGISGGLNQYAFVDNNPVNGIDPFGLYNIWNPATWGVANGVGYRWYDSFNPLHESAGWSGAAEGAIGGAAASVDGLIPFFDPFEDIYVDECGNVGGVYTFSRGVGGTSLGILAGYGVLRGGANVASRGGTVGRWLSQGRYWRLGNSGVHGPTLRIGTGRPTPLNHIDLRFFGK